jgi:hypothetical protein
MKKKQSRKAGLDKKELQRSRPTLARSRCIEIVGPTLAKIQANIYKLLKSSDNL